MLLTSCGQHGKIRRDLCYVLLLQAALLLKLTEALREGDACSMKSVSGVCTLTSKCNTLEPLVKRGQFSVREVLSCGFDLHEEIICCPISGQTETNPTTPTQTTVVFKERTITSNPDSWKDLRPELSALLPPLSNTQLGNRSYSNPENLRPEPAVPLAPLSKTQFGNCSYSNPENLRPEPAVPLVPLSNTQLGKRPYNNSPNLRPKPVVSLTPPSNNHGYGYGRARGKIGLPKEPQNNDTMWPGRHGYGGRRDNMGGYPASNDSNNQPDLQSLTDQQVISTNTTTNATRFGAAPQRAQPVDISPTPPTPTARSTANISTMAPITTRIDERPAIRACRLLDADLTPSLFTQILEGTPVELGDYPHMVAIGYSTIGNDVGPYEFRCGGSLIDKRFVLTAAHCVTSRESQPSIARMGVTNFADEEQMRNVVEIKIEKIHIHPEFANSRKYNDIAILQLERAVEYTNNIYATCLYTELTDPPLESDLYVTGWGLDSTRRLSKHLLKAKLQITSVESCNQSFLGDNGKNTRSLPYGVDNTLVCAFDPEVRKDACEGDSGGPLNLVLDQRTRKYRVVGIISSGFICGTAVPGLYTRVAHFLDYIEDLVWPSSK